MRWSHLLSAGLAVVLWDLPLQAGTTPAAISLPCPLSSGWEVARQLELPRRNAAGEPIGGFSAAYYDGALDSLWLLSDLPTGTVSRWGGLAAGTAPSLLEQIPLRSGPGRRLPATIDGEGFVHLAGQWWVASEGRRSPERRPQLFRFNAPGGTLLDAFDLPEAWRPGEGSGLASNGGPESLLLHPRTDRGQAPSLLMASEHPLLQDPPRQVRLLRWSWPAGTNPLQAAPTPTPQGALLLPRGDGWGLTDLLTPGPGQLLGLLRRFEPPDRWQIRLALYPLPAAGSTGEAAPLAEWDLIASGLAPDNWEALSQGPPLPDGRPTLLLVSDDNLSPLQTNRLALLIPRDRCTSMAPAVEHHG